MTDWLIIGVIACVGYAATLLFIIGFMRVGAGPFQPGDELGRDWSDGDWPHVPADLKSLRHEGDI